MDCARCCRPHSVGNNSGMMGTVYQLSSSTCWNKWILHAFPSHACWKLLLSMPSKSGSQKSYRHTHHTDTHSHKTKRQQHKQTKLTWRGFQRGTWVTWTAVFFMAPLVGAKHSNGQCCYYYCWKKSIKKSVSQCKPKPCHVYNYCMMNLGLILTVKLYMNVWMWILLSFSPPPPPPPPPPHTLSLCVTDYEDVESGGMRCFGMMQWWSWGIPLELCWKGAQRNSTIWWNGHLKCLAS